MWANICIWIWVGKLTEEHLRKLFFWLQMAWTSAIKQGWLGFGCNCFPLFLTRSSSLSTDGENCSITLKSFSAEISALSPGPQPQLINRLFHLSSWQDELLDTVAKVLLAAVEVSSLWLLIRLELHNSHFSFLLLPVPCAVFICISIFFDSLLFCHVFVEPAQHFGQLWLF